MSGPPWIMSVRWNELEDREADGIDRIRQVTEQKFAGVLNVM